MTVSIRLDKLLQQQLEQAARCEGVSRSALIRRCLAEYLGRRQPRASPWELGRHLFGHAGSGCGDLSRNRKRILRHTFRKVFLES